MIVPAVKKTWKDAMLAEQIPMYGQQWSRGQVLDCLLMHQAHHRGQMTVLMRQAGLNARHVVATALGPARRHRGPVGGRDEDRR